MITYYQDYVWKNGVPVGKNAATDGYKIVTDPYFKRYSIEKYRNGEFLEVVYDSHLLDFRSLKSPIPPSWQRLKISEDISYLRDENDRIVYKELLSFKEEFPFCCEVFSPQGILLSKHQMYYVDLGDSFNGVVLYDATLRAVMKKTYKFDPLSKEFTDLIEESWDIK